MPTTRLGRCEHCFFAWAQKYVVQFFFLKKDIPPILSLRPCFTLSREYPAQSSISLPRRTSKRADVVAVPRSNPRAAQFFLALFQRTGGNCIQKEKNKK